MATELQPVPKLPTKGVKFELTKAMEVVVRKLLHQLSEPPVLVYPNWDAVEDGSPPFRLHCDASKDGLGATLEQEQHDKSIRPILFLSRALSSMNKIGASWN